MSDPAALPPAEVPPLDVPPPDVARGTPLSPEPSVAPESPTLPPDSPDPPEVPPAPPEVPPAPPARPEVPPEVTEVPPAAPDAPPAPPPPAAPPPATPKPAPPYAAPDPQPEPRSRSWRHGTGGRRKDVGQIQPEPPAPPAAPAGALSDEPERPLGVRLARRLAPSRPVVTPPADVRRGPVRARRRPGVRVFAIIALLLIAALVFGIFKVFEPFAGDPGAPVKVAIPRGLSVGEIGDLLAKADVVDSGLVFNIRATVAGKRGDLQSGSYELRRDMTYSDVISAMSEPPSNAKGETIDVTIPEGRTRSEIVPIVRDANLGGDYLIASKRFAGALSPYRYEAPARTRSLEGFLFPSTYELRRNATARDLVERQLAAFKENFKGISLRRAHRRKLTAYDVLIIASMIEREAGVDSERRLISAVIYNRLKDGVPLGIDATIRYALRKPSGALTKSDLAINSAYNSRKRAGLPPTPIGNPGLASIRAAASPAPVNFRYFVVKPGTCSHAFSTTPRQFQRDYDRYNAARQETGKSPTSC